MGFNANEFFTNLETGTSKRNTPKSPSSKNSLKNLRLPKRNTLR